MKTDKTRLFALLPRKLTTLPFYSLSPENDWPFFLPFTFLLFSLKLFSISVVAASCKLSAHYYEKCTLLEGSCCSVVFRLTVFATALGCCFI